MASGGEQSDYFGASVAIEADLIAIGAPYRDNAGGVYLFRRSGGLWTEESLLSAPGAAAFPRFGAAVSLSGNRVLVGAYHDRVTEVIHSRPYDFYGSAYLYELSDGAWLSVERFLASYLGYGTHLHYPSLDFGSAVDLSGDTVIIGAADSGSACFYDLGTPPVTVTFDLDEKAVRAGGGELSQLVKIYGAAVEPVLSPDAGWLFDRLSRSRQRVLKDRTITACYEYDPSNTDDDVLWDGWETVHFGATNLTDGTIDSDGDGDLDAEEFESGNDPMDRSDYFHVMGQAVSPVDGQVTLRFTTNDDVGSRRYRILYTEDLSTTEPWTPLPMGAFAPDAGDSTEKTFDAPGDADAYFFKVEAFIE